MTHMRYWGLTLAGATAGAFIAIERFAFGVNASVWIAFGVAIAATLASVAAFSVGLTRENQAFSGHSAVSALIAGWTIIAMLVFSKSTASWLAFADGIALMLVSLRALALHETTIERVVHALERGAPTAAALQGAPTPSPAAAPSQSARKSEKPAAIKSSMGAWMYWLSHMGLAIAGAFIVLMSFAMAATGTPGTARWIAFGIGIAGVCVAGALSLQRTIVPEIGAHADGGLVGRQARLLASGTDALISVALIVTMAVYSGTSGRWIAFALGCALAGVSLLAAAIHELTSERVRHELEIAEPAGAVQQTPIGGAAA